MAFSLSTNVSQMPKDGSTLAVMFCTYSTKNGAITGRYVRMVKWDTAKNDWVEDAYNTADMVGPPLGWTATGALPF